MRPPLALPRLRFIRPIAGRVWLAEHLELGREVAVKLAASASDAPPSEEALAFLAVPGKHLLRVLESGTTDDGTGYLVTELAPGEPLAARLARGERLAHPELAALATQLGWAVGRLHGAGLVHGAVDAEHVIVEAAGSGLRARLVGSPRSTGQGGQAADVLALGTLLFEAADGASRAALRGWHARVTSSRPAARYPSALDLVDALSESAPPPASQRRPFDADAVLASLASLVSRRDPGAAGAVRDALPDLLDAERATDLAALLADRADPALDAARLIAIDEEGDARRVATAFPPTSHEVDARLAWAAVLRQRGRVEEALAHAPEIAEAGTPELAFQVGLFRARCLADRLARADAAKLLAGLEPERDGERALRDALLASVLAEDDPPRAHRCASAARDLLGAARPHERRRATAMLAHALYRLGRYREALHLLETTDPPAAGRARRLWDHIHACCLYDTGELDRTEAAASALADPDEPGALDTYVDCLRAGVLLLRGDADALAALLPSLRAAAARDTDLGSWISGLVARAGQQRRLRPAPVSEVSAMHVGSVFEAAAAARWGELPDAALRALRSATSGNVELRVQRGLALVAAALARGDADAALRGALEAAAESRAYGYALGEIEARVAVCEAHAVAGHREALARAGADVVALAGRMGASAPLAWGEVFTIAASGRADALARLEQLAASPGGPEASALARACLGGAAALDAVDTRVVAALRAWLPVTKLVGASGTDVSWGLDDRLSEAWLPSGERVSFRDTPVLWNLLAALADGLTHKGDLSMRVWGETAYHPLRHDNRLQAAVRKLRVRLHDDARSLVVTTDDGYALGGTVRRAG